MHQYTRSNSLHVKNYLAINPILILINFPAKFTVVFAAGVKRRARYVSWSQLSHIQV